MRYTTGSVISRDGTTIGFREFGHGPGIVAIHGAAQAAQNFTRLAEALSDAFTVYVPDRRGRGLSGPQGDHYGITSECEDVDAILSFTGSHNVFGLSSGAIIALESALRLPAIRKVAVYEPPLSVNHSTPINWLARYDREVAEDRLGSALVTAIRGTQTAPLLMRLAPRFVLDPLLNTAARASSPDAGKARTATGDERPTLRRRALRVLLWPVRRASSGNDRNNEAVAQGDDVPLAELVATMHYDVQLVIETEGTVEHLRKIPAEVLLMGGSRSPLYLKTSLRALSAVLPNARQVELAGLDHLAPDNGGRPGQIAAELRRFFASPAR